MMQPTKLIACSKDAFHEWLENWNISNLLLKVTNVCTFHCKYCFWFRDPEVKKMPDFLTEEIIQALLDKVEKHIMQHELPYFRITLHGGEPLLFGLARTRKLLDSFLQIGHRQKSIITFSIQSNGYLINDEWAEFFKEYNINVGISLDGPKYLQDQYRVTTDGRSSFDRVVQGIHILQKHGIDFGILAVCNPTSHPKEVTDFMVQTLGIKNFDILIPDFTHDDTPIPSIHEYYIALFDHWIEHYSNLEVSIRVLENFIETLLGLPGKSETIGYGPMTVITIETNGNIGPTDTLRIGPNQHLNTGMNILTHDLDQIPENEHLRWIIQQSLSLCQSCQDCEYCTSCGGGYLPHRWSTITQDYQHPSIYCQDIQKIFRHIQNYLEQDVSIQFANGQDSIV